MQDGATPGDPLGENRAQESGDAIPHARSGNLPLRFRRRSSRANRSPRSSTRRPGLAAEGRLSGGPSPRTGGRRRLALTGDPPAHRGIAKSCGPTHRSRFCRAAGHPTVRDGPIPSPRRPAVESEMEGEPLGHLLRVRPRGSGTPEADAVVGRVPIRRAGRVALFEGRPWASRHPRRGGLPSTSTVALTNSAICSERRTLPNVFIGGARKRQSAHIV